jgi:membrane protein DedA with SNARE-associated domain
MQRTAKKTAKNPKKRKKNTQKRKKRKKTFADPRKTVFIRTLYPVMRSHVGSLAGAVRLTVLPCWRCS